MATRFPRRAVLLLFTALLPSGGCSGHAGGAGTPSAREAPVREQAEARDEDPILAGVRRAVARGEEGLRDLGEALSRAAEAVIARGDEALLVHTLAHYSEIFAYASESFHVEPFLPVHEHDPAMLMRALERAMGPADRRRFMDDLYIVSETAECGNDPLPECVAAFAEKWRERHP